MPKRMNNGARHCGGYSTTFGNYNDDQNVLRSIVGFTKKIWGGPKLDRFGFVASSRSDGSRWYECAIDMADPAASLNAFLSRHSRWEYNLFFCPNLFSQPSRKKEFALSTRWAWCDMDASRWREYRPFPSVCWKTSPGRYQAIWHWDRRHSRQEAEAYSRSLTYRHGGDRNGWSITKMLRVPGSINHKPEYNEPIVKLVHTDWRPIFERSKPVKYLLGESTCSRMSVRPNRHNPDEVVEKHRRRLKHYILRLLEDKRVIGKDRSGRIFEIIVAFHAAGATPDEIAAVLWRNVYFLSKHGENLVRLEAEISRVVSKLEGRP